MTSKRKRKTHLTLLIYVFLMLAGSAIWLKYTLRGDRTGHPRSQPSWLRMGVHPNLTQTQTQRA